MAATLPPDLVGPVQVALARAAERIPSATALPGGSRYEPKWDGFRLVIVREPGVVRLWSRRGTDLTSTFPEIAAAAEHQLPPSVVLDGEVVVWSGGQLDFGALQTRMGRGARGAAAHARTHPSSYAAFDVLAVVGRDTRPAPYDDRRSLLEQLAADWTPPMNLSPVTTDREVAVAWFEEFAAAGVEGLVVKGGAQLYPAGRRGWLKVKRRSTLDVVCGAVIGTRTAPREVVAGLPVGGQLRIVGRTGPLSVTARRELAQWLVEPVGAHPWPTRPPRALSRFRADRTDVALTLVDPLVVEVNADAAWDGRSFRHVLRFVRARPDAEVSSVVTPDGPDAVSSD